MTGEMMAYLLGGLLLLSNLLWVYKYSALPSKLIDKNIQELYKQQELKEREGK